jgi:hypothetical protein
MIKLLTALRAALITGVLSGCGGATTPSPSAALTTPAPATAEIPASKQNKTTGTTISSTGITITGTPATEGSPLFSRGANPGQNVAGFEFCCAGYNGYTQHEFTNATGDMLKLEGGTWATGIITGALGDRVFSSKGDGYENYPGAPLAPIGNTAVGTLNSPGFVITSQFINFMVGGGINRYGSANPTTVVLVVDGQPVRQSHGSNEPARIAWDTWDVRGLLGKIASIQIIDQHPDDYSDTAVPYLLLDQFRAADKAAVLPTLESFINPAPTSFASNPATAGTSLFTNPGNTSENAAGFEICCGYYEGYHEHGYYTNGDFIRFTGGQWASDIVNRVGDRVFASYGQGYANNADIAGRWYGWEATGSLISPSFKITANYINFLAGGGTNKYDSPRATSVVLRVNGKVVRQATGNGRERELNWVTWDVSSLVNQYAQLEVIDLHDNAVSDGSYPFILLDEFRQASQAATTPASDSLVSRADGHLQAINLNMGDANPFYRDGTYYIYYLQNTGYHPWHLVKTTNLLDVSFSTMVLPASGDASKPDQWTGSGSVFKDNSNKFHLFYTEHNDNISPVERVMRATAADTTLTKWTPVSSASFSGSGGYSTTDFRDPAIFWNSSEQKYWMLITSRYNGQAAIGLYKSTNLTSWTAAAPLYTENSPLNLEVADYFELTQTPFIVYSDQRDESRQVKYLTRANNIWGKAVYDALDGKSFYAARTAGDANERLLFGWVPHTNGRQDGAWPMWGGDIMIHQLSKSASGEITVALPQRIKNLLTNPVAATIAWSDTGLSGNAENIFLKPFARFTLDAFKTNNRISLTATSSNASAVFGVQFRNFTNGKLAKLKIDALQDNASFYFEGDEGNVNNPSVNLPLDATTGINLDIYMNPNLGVGSVYINNYRALSFRLYDLKLNHVGVFTQDSAINISNLKRYTR